MIFLSVKQKNNKDPTGLAPFRRVNFRHENSCKYVMDFNEKGSNIFNDFKLWYRQILIEVTIILSLVSGHLI